MIGCVQSCCVESGYSHWQQIWSESHTKTVAICVRIKLVFCRRNLLTGGVSRLATETAQILLTGNVRRLHCADPVQFLPPIEHQIMLRRFCLISAANLLWWFCTNPVRFLLLTCCQIMSAGFAEFSAILLLLSNVTGFVYNL